MKEKKEAMNSRFLLTIVECNLHLQRIDMEPEHELFLWKGTSASKLSFLGSMLVFGGVKIDERKSVPSLGQLFNQIRSDYDNAYNGSTYNTQAFIKHRVLRFFFTGLDQLLGLWYPDHSNLLWWTIQLWLPHWVNGCTQPEEFRTRSGGRFGRSDWCSCGGHWIVQTPEFVAYVDAQYWKRVLEVYFYLQ